MVKWRQNIFLSSVNVPERLRFWHEYFTPILYRPAFIKRRAVIG